MSYSELGRGARGARRLIGAAIATFVVCGDLPLRADLGLGGAISNGPSGPRYTLTWDGIGAATYGVQVSSNLLGPAAWTSVDIARPASSGAGSAKWMSPESLSEGRFYRLLGPQPEIHSVEPAVFAPGTNVNLYVLGQFFATGDVVHVDGVSLGTPTFLDHTTLQFLLPPTGAGAHTVEVYRAGGLLSSFVVTCASATDSPEQVFQEPPELPVAAPMAGWLAKKGYDHYMAQSALVSKKGYDYYKAQSDLNSAGLHHNPYFSGNVLSGEMPGSSSSALLFALLSKKGYDHYMARSDLSSAGTPVNPYFAGNELAGDVPGTSSSALLIGFLTKKGYDHHKARSDLSSAGLQTNPAFQESRNVGQMPRVAPSSGQTVVNVVDLAAPGRSMDFVFARSYRSRTGPTNSTMGTRWTHSYDVWCMTNSMEATVADGMGRKDIFRKQPDGRFTSPGLFSEGVATNTGFRLTFADTGYWEFAPPPGGSSAGKLVLVRLVDRAGNQMTLDYDGSGRLLHVVDDLGRTNTLAYDGSGHVQSVTDFMGRSVTYAYYTGSVADEGAAGDLKSVTSPPVTGTPNGNDFPAGRTTSYTYSHGFSDDRENHLLLTVVDPLGQTASRHVYQHNQSDLDFLRCVSVQRGIDKKDIRREILTPAPSNRFAVERVFINDYVGNVTECFFDARQRCVTMREFTGRATPGVAVSSVSNRPTAKLRSTDPDYYETTFSWNGDSLCTRCVLPGSNAVEFVYEADLNKSASPRKRCDLRVVREISGTGEPDLVTMFQHDPRFGSDPTASGMRTRLNELENVLKNIGLLGRAAAGSPDVYLPIKRGRGPRQSTLLDGSYSALEIQRLGGDMLIHGSALDFVTASTRKNGAIIACDYDLKGNRLRVATPWLTGSEVSFGYDAFGGLVSVTNAADANGRRRVDSFVLSNGLVVAAIIDSGAGGSNITSTCVRDAAGRVTRVADPLGNDSLFTYNALDECVRAETPTNISARSVTDFAYDANGNVLSITEDVRDETDVKTGTRTDQFTYDERNRLTLAQSQVDSKNMMPVGFAYDGNDNLVLASGGDAVSGTDPFNAVAYAYDERDLLFREISSPGSPGAATNTTAYTYNGNPATKKYVDDATSISITYDGFDRPVSVQDAMGNVAVSAYDACGNLTYTRIDGQTNDVAGSAGNRRLAECFYDYDLSLRCVRTRVAHFDSATQAPVGDGFSTTTITYAPNNDLIAVVDDLGHATSFACDTAGRCVSMWDPLSNRVEFAYDAAGNVLAETRRERSDLGGPEQVFVRVSGYDRLHRLTRSADNVGNTNRWFFNSLDQCVKEIDPRGFATFHQYDLLGRRTQTVGDLDGDGVASLSQDYSERATWSSSNPSRLLAATDSQGNTTTFSYDSLGRCTNTTFADGSQHKLIWSPRSNVVREDDANGTVVLRTYDLNNRCIAKTIAPGSGITTNTLAESFEFDGLSRLTRAHNEECDDRNDYDSLGDCVRETMNGLVTASTYNSLGHRMSLTYPGGRLKTISRDSLERCSSISDSGFAMAAFEYDGPGRLARVTYGNNQRTRILYDGLAGTNNAPGDFGWGRISRIRHSALNGQPILNDCTFTYDRDGNKITRVETLFAPALPRTNTLALGYDPMCRLTNATLVSNSALVRNTAYAFDREGNRTNVSGAACSGAYSLDATAPSPQDAQMNQYSSTPCDVRQYDENGNLTFVGAGAVSARIYTYDYANRLVSIIENGSPLSTYGYDALGRCISKTTYPGGLPPATIQYVYDGNAVIEERDGTNVVASYMFNPREYTITKASAWGRSAGPVSMRRGGADYYFHTDDQGNVLALTDTNGVCIERYTYDDYGAVTFLTSDGLSNSVTSSAVGNPYLYRGMRYAPESRTFSANDIHHNVSVYEPATGRALTRPRPNIPPLPGMCPGAMMNQPFGNNPWSAAKSKEVCGNGIKDSQVGEICEDLAKVPRNVLKEFFAKGDKPTQAQFGALIDSLVNMQDDGITSFKTADSIHRREFTGHVTLMK